MYIGLAEYNEKYNDNLCSKYLSLDMRFPTMWYARPAKAQTSLPPGRVAQSVTCLATDACLTADPGVASSNDPVPYYRGD